MLLKPAFPVLDRGHWQADGLLGAWLCSEGAGHTITDHSRRYAPGTIEGADWRAGLAGSDLVFSGSSYVDLGDNIANTQLQGTLSATITPTGDGTIFGVASASDGNRLWQWQVVNNRLRVGINFDDVTFYRTAQVLVYGHSYRVAITANGAQWRMYVDGMEVSLTQQTGSVPGRWWGHAALGDAGADYRYTVGVAMRSGSPISFFSGVISDILSFDHPMSPSEIAHIHHDPYAAFREPRSKFAWLFVSPPENLTAPTLQINPDGTWSGGLGTWTNNPTNYAWELRRSADDSVVDSGSTSDAEAVLVGSGLGVGNYYLWVLASNSGGSGVGRSGVGRYAARMRVEAVGSYTPIAVRSAYVGGAIAKQGSAV